MLLHIVVMYCLFERHLYSKPGRVCGNKDLQSLESNSP